MKIALYGATGNIGQRILNEVLQRGHEITAIVRDPAKVTMYKPNLKVVRGDIFNSENVASLTAGHNIVISAYGQLNGEGFVDVTQSLINGVKRSGAHRLLVVGGVFVLA